jgi:hypothetical protein
MIKTTLRSLLESDQAIARIVLKTDENGELIKRADGKFLQRELPAGLAFDFAMLRRAMAPFVEEYMTAEREIVERLNVQASDIPEDTENRPVEVDKLRLVGEVEALGLQAKEVELSHTKKIAIGDLEKAGVRIGSYDLETLLWLLEV